MITLTITSRPQGILRLFIETLPRTRKKTVLSTTVKPRYNEPLYSKVFGITNDFLCPVIIKYMEKNLDITKPRYSEQIWQSGLAPSLYRGSTVINNIVSNIYCALTNKRFFFTSYLWEGNSSFILRDDGYGAFDSQKKMLYWQKNVVLSLLIWKHREKQTGITKVDVFWWGSCHEFLASL